MLGGMDAVDIVRRGREWAVVGRLGRYFTGTYEECETWLDENAWQVTL